MRRVNINMIRDFGKISAFFHNTQSIHLTNLNSLKCRFTNFFKQTNKKIIFQLNTELASIKYDLPN